MRATRTYLLISPLDAGDGLRRAKGRRTMQGLSQRQNSILEYIQRFMKDSGYPPSIRDIQDKLKISSTSVVAYNLRKLEERGLIERDNRVSRGIKVPGGEPAP